MQRFLSTFENRLRTGLVYIHNTQTHPAAEQNKNVKWSESPWSQSGKEKVCGAKDLSMS